MSAVSLLKVAAEDDLYTGADGNPWGHAWTSTGQECAVDVLLSLWDCGLLSLPKQRLEPGWRRWEITELGRVVLKAAWKVGPPGYIPTPGGPYD